jgi:hypothetical protein
MVAPFEMSRLKIERARKHVAEIETVIASYLSRDPVSLIVEAWAPMPINHAWNVRIVEPVPPTLSPILGDAIHNLRSALDLSACELVRLEGKNVKGVYFPFADHEGGLPDRIERRNFKRAGRRAVELVTALKPYGGGNALLHVIHELDVTDKHTALLPVIGVASSPSAKIRFFGNKVPTPVPQIDSQVAADGQSLVVMPPVDELPLGTKLPLRWNLAFGQEAGKMNGYPLVPALHEFTKIVVEIVDLFSREFATVRGILSD